MFVTVSMISVSMASSCLALEGSADVSVDGSEIGKEGLGGRERNFEGSRGTHSPVGVPIVFNTESHPSLSSIRTPSRVLEIIPSTKKAVLTSVNYPNEVHTL